MGQPTFFDQVREWIGGIAFATYLWSVGLTKEEFWAEQDRAAKQQLQEEGWIREKMCVSCGHSESRHRTAGGFCKHCPCNAFVEIGDNLPSDYKDSLQVLINGKDVPRWLGGQ